VSERIEELEAYEGRVADDAATLLELLELREAIFRDLEQVMTYAQLRSAEDTRNQEYQAMSAKASSLGSEASSTISYLEPELQSLTEADVAAFVDDEPALAEYEHYLDDVTDESPHAFGGGRGGARGPVRGYRRAERDLLDADERRHDLRRRREPRRRGGRDHAGELHKAPEEPGPQVPRARPRDVLRRVGRRPQHGRYVA